MDGLGDAVDIASLAPLHLILEENGERTRLVVHPTGRANEVRLPATRAEALLHDTRNLETPMAAEHIGLEAGDARQLRGDEVEVHAEGDVLHGVVGGEDGGLEGDGWLVGGFLGGGAGAVFGFLLFDVGGGDPFAFVVGRGGVFVFVGRFCFFDGLD